MKENLRFKIVKMSLSLIAVAVALFAFYGVGQVRRFADIMEETGREQSAVILDTMSESMHETATESYQKYVSSEAQLLDAAFRNMRHDLKVLAKQVRTVLEQPEAYAPAEVLPPSRENAGILTPQLLYSDTADRDDPLLTDRILRLGGLGSMMLEIVEGNEALQDCVISLPDGASIIVDRQSESKIGEDGEAKPFNADRRPWYVGALVRGETCFTPVNRDNYLDMGEVMAGVPVYVDGELAAVCAGSVRLDSLAGIISNAQLGDYSDICLVNQYGNIIYSSVTGGDLGMERNELKSLKESVNADLVALVNGALEGNAGFSLIPVDGKETYVAYAPLETLGWTLLLSVSREDLNRTAYLLAQKTDDVIEESIADLHANEVRLVAATLFIAAILIIFAAFSSTLFSGRLVRPIKRMTQRVSEMEGDDMSFEVEDILLTGDEIEVLARAFAKMSEKMQGYVREIVRITTEKQRLDTELSVASDIQANMLPSRFPAFPDRPEFDLYAVMDPAKEVGGDFYDFFMIDGDRLAVVMADVSGKGIPAALFMVISKTLIKNVTLSAIYTSPAEILQDVNDRLCEGNEDSMFVTVWLGILTVSTGELVSACAGHEFPVFYRKGRGFMMEKDPHGLAMGALEGSRYRDVQWKLDPGDMLFLYTDGVPEANNGRQELYGNDRMMAALKGALPAAARNGDAEETDLKEFLRLVRKDIDAFVDDTPQFDDLTMLCLKYRGGEDKG